MKLADFPGKIAQLERELLERNKLIRQLQSMVDGLQREINILVYDNDEIETNAQRKLKRIELQQSRGYFELLDRLQGQKDDRKALIIQLEKIRSEFAVAKFQARQVLALQELKVNSAI